MLSDSFGGQTFVDDDKCPVLVMSVKVCAFGYDVVFFQAEDGIRDAQESRGLGDVYKRQSQACGSERSPRGFPRGR